MNNRSLIGAVVFAAAATALQLGVPARSLAQNGTGSAVLAAPRPAEPANLAAGKSAGAGNAALLTPPLHNYDATLQTKGVKNAAARQAIGAYLQKLDAARHRITQAHLEKVLSENQAGHTPGQVGAASQKYSQSVQDYESVRKNGADQLQRQLGAAWTPGVQAMVADREIHESHELTPHWNAPPLVPATPKERAIAARTKPAPRSAAEMQRLARENMAVCCGK